MRLTGTIETARGCGLHDHLCWAYDDPNDLANRTLEFLGEGLEQGLRICYVNAGSVDSLRSDLGGLPDLEREISRGAVKIASIDGLYPTDSIVDRNAQVDAYRSLTEQALEDGLAGFRLVAEATPMATSNEQLLAFVGYEFLVDGLMAVQPFSAMCAYNARTLDAEAISALAAVYPSARERSTQFHLYNLEGADLALSGEIDAGVQLQFERALEGARVVAAGGQLKIDATELVYLDHRTLFSLVECALRSGASAVLRTRLTMPTRLAHMLQIDGIEIERVS